MVNEGVSRQDEDVLATIDEVLVSLESINTNSLADSLSAMHTVDIAKLIESLPATARGKIVSCLTQEQTSLILPLLGDEVRRQLLQEIPTPQLSVVAELLKANDLAVAIDELPNDISDQILASLDADNRGRLDAVLDYPVGSAGRLMTLDTLSVRPTAKLSVVLRWLRRLDKLPPYTSALMVTDDTGAYVGKLLMGDVVTGDADVTVSSVMQATREIIRASASEHEVAKLFGERHLITVAVLDDDDKLVGRITVDHAMDIIRREADHALLSRAGLKDEADLFAPIIPSAKQRGIWLGINLITVFMAAWVIGQFQEALDQLVALAVLMPIVASMGGIAGSQTLTLTIRGLALNQIAKNNVRWLAKKEIYVGALNGFVWSIVVAAATYLWFRNIGLSIVIGVALILNLLAAAISGVVVPLVLKRVGMDPALAGAVVLTTVTDIVGFFSFLGLAAYFLL